MPEDGIYRSILTVLAASVVGGVLAMLAGEYLLLSPALKTVGAGSALVCVALYFLFRLLGRREMRRRAEAEGRDRGPDRGGA